jgi:hypothetical protein
MHTSLATWSFSVVGEREEPRRWTWEERVRLAPGPQGRAERGRVDEPEALGAFARAAVLATLAHRGGVVYRQRRPDTGVELSPRAS